MDTHTHTHTLTQTHRCTSRGTDERILREIGCLTRSKVASLFHNQPPTIPYYWVYCKTHCEQGCLFRPISRRSRRRNNSKSDKETWNRKKRKSEEWKRDCHTNKRTDRRTDRRANTKSQVESQTDKPVWPWVVGDGPKNRIQLAQIRRGSWRLRASVAYPCIPSILEGSWTTTMSPLTPYPIVDRRRRRRRWPRLGSRSNLRWEPFLVRFPQVFQSKPRQNSASPAIGKSTYRINQSINQSSRSNMVSFIHSTQREW